MRTWDRIRIGEWDKRATPVEWQREPVIVLGDEVAQMIRAGVKPEFPVCAPPWDDFVIEMQPSPWPLSLSTAGKFLLPKKIGVTQNESIAEVKAKSGWDTNFATGVVLSFTNMSDRADSMPWGALPIQKAKEIQALIRSVRESGGWLLGIEMIADFPSGVIPVYWSAILIGSDGSAESIGSCYSFITNRSVEDGTNDPEWIAFDALLGAGLMAISMINCSNIGMEDETPDYTRPDRRRLSRKDKPLVSFKRLHIKPHKSRRSDGSADGGDVAIHLVRGHFKTYTAEKPLLGKLTGTWWWQPQVRGSAPRFVTKDYEVEP